MTDAADLGARGEALAAQSYEADGYRIAARNFRTRQGEIDLILRKGRMLVFCEVKTRTTFRCGAPREAVTPAKQRRIIAAALAYLSRLGTDDFSIRFDVVEVVPDGAAWRCNRLEQAFEAF